jgi:hypothetical protein
MIDTIVDIWIGTLLKEHKVQDIQELPLYVIKSQILEMKGTLENEKAFLAGGQMYSKENIKHIKRYIKLLKGALEL